LATKYLLSLGHTKIAYLGGHWPTSSNLERLEGYKRALEEAGIEVRDEYIYCGEFRMENGYREGIKILRQESTDLLPFFQLMMLWLLDSWRPVMKRGKSTRRIIYYRIDDIPLSASRLIQLTTVSQSTAELGSLSGKIIMDKVLNPRKKDVRQQIVFPPKLVIRGTCARIKEE